MVLPGFEWVRGLATDNPSPILIRGKTELPSPARGEGAVTSTAPAASIFSQPPARADDRRVRLFLLRGRRLLLRRSRSGSGSGGSARSGARSTRGRSRARRGARRRALGGNAGFRGSGRRGGGGSGGFGRRLHLFRVARRRHDGDEGVIELAHDAHVRRQRDLAQVLRVIDLETRDIDV